MRRLKRFFSIVIFLCIVAVGVFAVRIFLGGDEDTWICEKGVWVRHGNPSSPMPTEPCGGETLPAGDGNGTVESDLPYLYRFEDYPVTDVFTGVPAPVDFSTKPGSERFRTVISDGAKAGPNFAGRYTVVTWGCGTSCQSSAIIDAQTGRIVAFGIPSGYEVEFQKESRLFIVNALENVFYSAMREEGIEIDYYELKDGTLSFLEKQAADENEPRFCIQEITRARNPLTNEERDFPTPCSIPFGWEMVE